MIHSQTSPGRSALYATVCSYLGLSARDLAEIGDFSERFARDLLSGRRPFPQDTQVALQQLVTDCDTTKLAFIGDIQAGERFFYIYRTNEQLRASPVGKVLNGRGKAAGGFVGPYRVAIFDAWRDALLKGIEVDLIFANWPDVPASEQN
jgi:sugar/nucleoside kinase (ribokinase family)